MHAVRDAPHHLARRILAASRVATATSRSVAAITVNAIRVSDITVAAFERTFGECASRFATNRRPSVRDHWYGTSQPGALAATIV